MPRDYQTSERARPMPIRAAVIELMSQAAADGELDEAAYLAALRAIVARGRSRADDLWDKYHSGPSDRRARVFARYGD
jgi:gamma-glutamylcysteine synthetase